MRWNACTARVPRSSSRGDWIDSVTVGVSITTRNRRVLFTRTLRCWRRWTPADVPLVVVDDASDVPFPDIDGLTVIRNEHRLGVAMSKNRGIAALMDLGCDHLFLADDDVVPIVDRWWEPYVDSPEPHLSHQRDFRAKDGDETHFAVGFPRGYLLYAERMVIDTVGGMDPAYGAWGGEHVEWQKRIHDAGLTTWAYADVRGSGKLWSAINVRSTAGGAERKRMLAATGIQWQKRRPRFVPYREGHGMQEYNLGPRVQEGEPWSVLRHVLDLAPAGVAVEFGVGSGSSTRVIAERMPVVGFDSGQGLPEDWRPGYSKGSLAWPIPQVPNATIVEGWFDDTLPGFDFDKLGYIGLVHFDADLYSSTRTALKYVGPYLQSGCYCCFDEWWGYPGAQEHEWRAWKEFADETGIGWTVVGHGEQQWAIRIS